MNDFNSCLIKPAMDCSGLEESILKKILLRLKITSVGSVYSCPGGIMCDFSVGYRTVLIYDYSNKRFIYNGTSYSISDFDRILNMIVFA